MPFSTSLHIKSQFRSRVTKCKALAPRESREFHDEPLKVKKSMISKFPYLAATKNAFSPCQFSRSIDAFLRCMNFVRDRFPVRAAYISKVSSLFLSKVSILSPFFKSFSTYVIKDAFAIRANLFVSSFETGACYFFCMALLSPHTLSTRVCSSTHIIVEKMFYLSYSSNALPFSNKLSISFSYGAIFSLRIARFFCLLEPLAN